jgi:hypothetical protein
VIPPVVYHLALVKFNGGRGALLCNDCRLVIAIGFNHTDTLHYCPACIQQRLTTNAVSG